MTWNEPTAETDAAETADLAPVDAILETTPGEHPDPTHEVLGQPATQ